LLRAISPYAGAPGLLVRTRDLPEAGDRLPSEKFVLLLRRIHLVQENTSQQKNPEKLSDVQDKHGKRRINLYHYLRRPNVMNSTITAVILTFFLLSPPRPWGAGEAAKLEFTPALVKVSNQVIYEEKKKGWRIYEAAFNPAGTHLLISREYDDSREFKLRDFKVLQVSADRDRVLSAAGCALDKTINFEQLHMIEAYWATDWKVGVRTIPPPPEKKAGVKPGAPVTVYYEIVRPPEE
jgi:hypothetical protein